MFKLPIFIFRKTWIILTIEKVYFGPEKTLKISFDRFWTKYKKNLFLSSYYRHFRRLNFFLNWTKNFFLNYLIICYSISTKISFLTRSCLFLVKKKSIVMFFLSILKTEKTVFQSDFLTTRKPKFFLSFGSFYSVTITCVRSKIYTMNFIFVGVSRITQFKV